MFYLQKCKVRRHYFIVLFLSALHVTLLLYTFGDHHVIQTIHRQLLAYSDQNRTQNWALNQKSVTKPPKEVFFEGKHSFLIDTTKRPNEITKSSKEIIAEGVRENEAIKTSSEVAKSSKDVIDKTAARAHQNAVIKKLRGVGNPVVHGDKLSRVVKGHGGYPLTAFGVLVKPRANATAKWSLGNATNPCPPKPGKLEGDLFTYKDAPNFESIMQILEKYGLEPGGHYHPPKCRARHRVAIIIPYRDRQNHLHVLLSNLHPMLMRQEIDYFILVVEMALPTEFNRGLLLNIGAVEALGLWDVHCFIIHDVDLIPENDHNLYTCPDHFRHMSVAIDKFKYRKQTAAIIGGVSAIDKKVFNKLNGFSNMFFGWGGEDIEFFYRLRGANMTVVRPSLSVARYWMFKHPRDKTNPENPLRFLLLKNRKVRQPKDGLNTLKYEVLDLQFRSGYTWILVNVEKAAYLPKPKRTKESSASEKKNTEPDPQSKKKNRTGVSDKGA